MWSFKNMDSTTDLKETIYIPPIYISEIHTRSHEYSWPPLIRDIWIMDEERTSVNL